MKIFKEKGRYEIRISGSGGQGIILATMTLAEALALEEGNFVAQTQSYGPESRGGFVKGDIVVSLEEIDYPLLIKADLLLAMNQRGCEQNLPELKEEGILIVDSTYVEDFPKESAIAIPFSQISKEEFGQKEVANFMALGVMTALGLVRKSLLVKVIRKKLPPIKRKINLDALKIGENLGAIEVRRWKKRLKEERISKEEAFTL